MDGTASPRSVDEHQDALVEILSLLKGYGYRFVTPTPRTHHRVIARPGMALARDLRGVFGWSLPFEPRLLPGELLQALTVAGEVATEGRLLRARLRASSLDGALFLHSAFPTDAPDSVFLGPDSYRFAQLIRREIVPGAPLGTLVDIGAGAGVGAIVAARTGRADRVVMVDSNPKALRLARANAAAAGVAAEFVQGDGFEGAPERADLILANPPFIADSGRDYSDGGDMLGAAISLDWAQAACDRLRPGGRMLLYTGSAIVNGFDRLRQALEARLEGRPFTLDYREIDPDIFGSELETPAYAEVERIAAVGAVITRAW